MSDRIVIESLLADSKLNISDKEGLVQYLVGRRSSKDVDARIFDML